MRGPQYRLASALLLSLVASSGSWASGPFEKNHPLVEEGTQAYERQAFEQALSKYEAAAKERPSDARVQYDKGLALHKLGRDEEAKQALTRALELDSEGTLASKIHYNLGTIAAGQQQREEALSQFRRALRKDPSDEMARHNLEVMLRNLPPKSQRPDGGTDDGGTSDAGRDGGTDAGQDAGPDGGNDGGSDGGPSDGGTGDGGPSDGGSDGGRGEEAPGDGGGGRGDAGQGSAQEGARGDAGTAQEASAGDGGVDGGAQIIDGGIPLSQQSAQQLLDALKNSEKNLQLWRFKKATQKNDAHGKDW